MVVDSNGDDHSSIVKDRNDEDDKLKRLTAKLLAAEEALASERKRSNELLQRLRLKAVSIDCQLIENETLLSDCRADLSSARRTNRRLTETIAGIRSENEFLLKRTAALARRDQIQKAAIASSHAEIAKLSSTIDGFRVRFESLASGVTTVKTTTTTKTGEGESSARGGTRIIWRHDAETTEAKEIGEKQSVDNQKIGTVERIVLNRSPPPPPPPSSSIELQMKLRFIEILTKHQSVWELEREGLRGKIFGLEQQLLLHQEPREVSGKDDHGEHTVEHDVTNRAREDRSTNASEEAHNAAVKPIEPTTTLETAETIEYSLLSTTEGYDSDAPKGNVLAVEPSTPKKIERTETIETTTTSSSLSSEVDGTSASQIEIKGQL